MTLYSQDHKIEIMERNQYKILSAKLSTLLIWENLEISFRNQDLDTERVNCLFWKKTVMRQEHRNLSTSSMLEPSHKINWVSNPSNQLTKSTILKWCSRNKIYARKVMQLTSEENRTKTVAHSEFNRLKCN